MSITIKNGTIITLDDDEILDTSKNVNGVTFAVQGDGTLNLGHDANGANVTMSTTATMSLPVTVAHDINNAVVTDIGGVLTVGHDANGATFNLSAGGTVELSHSFVGATFALTGQNNKIVLGLNGFPVEGSSLTNQITGLDLGDRIELNGQSFSSAIFSGHTITLSNGFQLTNVG